MFSRTKKKKEKQKSHLSEISLDRRPRLSKPAAISSSAVDAENSFRVVGKQTEISSESV